MVDIGPCVFLTTVAITAVQHRPKIIKIPAIQMEDDIIRSPNISKHISMVKIIKIPAIQIEDDIIRSPNVF